MAAGGSQREGGATSGFAQDRERLIAAVAKGAAEHGYAGMTVEQIATYAGLSPEIFSLHFESKEQGLVAAQEAFMERLWLDAAGACDEGETWPRKVRAGLRAVLASLVETSGLARVFAVEAQGSLVLAERQLAALDRFALMLRQGRYDYPEASTLPEATERTLVGGIASIVSAHLMMEETAAIPTLGPDLVELVLIPYVGREEARQAALA